MSNKKKNLDKISGLSDCLLYHILSLLNTKQVVQTCVLSKRWKYVWTRIPTLDFNFYSYPFEGPSRNFSLKERSFKHFIFSVLSRRSGTYIQKLSYTFFGYDEGGILSEMLICYARSHMVQELCINTIDTFDWKWCLLEWRSLTVLKMSCRYVDDWGLLVLPSLKSLEIESYTYREVTKHGGSEMFSGCPNLESLVFVDALYENASISGPKLENFEVHLKLREVKLLEVELLTPSLKCVKFNNVVPTVKCSSDLSYLEKVNIALDDIYEYSDKQKLARDLLKLLEVFHNARSLTMPLKALEVLLSAPPSLSGSLIFDNLRHLKLKTEETSKMIDLPISLWAYLQKCPTLKTLVVDLNQD